MNNRKPVPLERLYQDKADGQRRYAKRKKRLNKKMAERRQRRGN